MNTLKRYLGCLLGSGVLHGVAYVGCPLLDGALPSAVALAVPSTPLGQATSLLTWAYLLTYVFSPHKGEGERWDWFCNRPFWRAWVLGLLPGASVRAQAPLDHSQNYIFASFPHGAISVNHILSMTNAVGFLSDIHRGERRDLAASVLFYLPGVREILLWLGNVDAGAPTAKLNLRKKRSLLIFVGGEKEQLLTRPGTHQVHCASRFGFVKLALTYGAPLVPLYTFGENECYHVSNWCMSLRQWLQKHFSLGLTLCWGRGWLWMSPLLLQSPLSMQVGLPVPLPPKFRANNAAKSDKERMAPTDEEVKAYHQQFLQALEALFDTTKAAHGVSPDAKLVIH